MGSLTTLQAQIGFTAGRIATLNSPRAGPLQTTKESIGPQRGALNPEASGSDQTETDGGTVANGLGELHKLKWHECQYGHYQASKSLVNHGGPMVSFLCPCKHQ